MKKNYFLIVLLAILFSETAIAQETQKNLINYQGVARNADNALMASEAMTINIALKFGAANAATVYEESHALMTDANGVFSLLIGNGGPVSGDYNSLPWGNAATFVTVSMNGNEVGTTEMMAVPYAISSGDADDQSAAEVSYNNTTSGLTATTTQEAIDELSTGGTVDADADPTNEFQTLSFNAGTNELSLSDGNSVTIPSGGTDADADPSNEFQTLSFDSGSNELSLSDGNSVTIPSGGTDADADPTNEIQTISFDATSNKISLTDGGEITIPSGGTDADADPTNEFQTLNFDAGTYELSLSDGNSVTIPSGGTDADADPTNEFQTISFDTGTNELSLSDGNSVVIPGGGDGGSLWTRNGNDVYLIDGDVGIGTTNPSAKLHVDGFIVSQDLSGTGLRNVMVDEDGRLVEGISGGSSLWSQTGSDIYFNSGKVGIGLTNPSTMHQVHSGSARSFTQYTTSTFGDNITDGLSVGLVNDLSFGAVGEIMNNEEGPLRLGTNGLSRLHITKEGDIGIGISNPTSKLDIDGNIKSRDLAGSGQRNVMADANGNLVIGTGGSGSLWTANGSNIHYEGGNVGVGTASPERQLHVVGNEDNSIRFESSTERNWVSYFNSSGYIGYAGIFTGSNDLDFGTALLNSTGKVHLTTNAIPKLTVVPNGNVGIGTTNPSVKLDVKGNVNASGEVNRTSTGSANMVPIAYGNVNENGTRRSGSDNYTSNKFDTGIYIIRVPDEEDARNWVISVTLISADPGMVTIALSGSGAPLFNVNTWSTLGRRDFGFSFVVYRK